MIGLLEKEEESGGVIDSLECVRSACEKLKINPDDVVDTHRFGAVGDSPRIMKITFGNSSARRAFLTGFRGVREGLL